MKNVSSTPSILKPFLLSSKALALLSGLGTTLLGAVVLAFGGAGAPLEGISACLLLLGAALAPWALPAKAMPKALEIVLGVALFLTLWLALGALPASPLGLDAHPLTQTLAPLGLNAAWAALGLNPLATLQALMLIIAYGLTFAWLLKAALHEDLALGLLRSVGVVVIAFAVYGLITFALGNTHVLWLEKTSYPNALTSTFISRNHAATLLGIGLLTCLSLGMQRIGEISRQLAPLQRAKALWLLVLKPGWPWFLGAAVIWIALILTTSRAGLAFTLIGTSVLLGALMVARAAVRWWLLAGTLALGTLALLVLGIAGAGVSGRAESGTSDASVRHSLNLLSQTATDTMPLTGHGAGSWANATEVVRSATLFDPYVGTLGNAHNLYWQTATELGWVGLLGLLILGGLMLACLLHGLQTRRRQIIFPALGLGVLGLVAGHSAVDFSLHIPAVVLAFMMVMAPALAQSFKETSAPVASKPWVPSLLALVGVGLVGYWGFVNMPLYRAERTVQTIQAGKLPAVADLREARTLLSDCITQAPWHAKCHENLALVHWARAAQMGLNTVNAQVLLKAAQTQAEAGLQLNPANATNAYTLAVLADKQGNPARRNATLTHSVLMGPNASLLAFVRAKLIVKALKESEEGTTSLTPDDTDLLQANLRGLWEQDALYLFHHTQKEPDSRRQLARAIAAGPLAPDLDQWQRITNGGAWPLGKAN